MPLVHLLSAFSHEIKQQHENFFKEFPNAWLDVYWQGDVSKHMRVVGLFQTRTIFEVAVFR